VRQFLYNRHSVNTKRTFVKHKQPMGFTVQDAENKQPKLDPEDLGDKESNNS
jgi:hypothetical protein